MTRSLTRACRTPDGLDWEIFEMLRIGIGERPVEPDVAVVAMTATDGRRHQAELPIGALATLSPEELVIFVEEVRAHDKASE